ncbi:MAG: DUF2341 domain-containing protein, partial [Candidatus Aenigmatarchaeota archaeon]
ITERSGNDLIDYQVLITLDTASLISQGKMRNDCGDIRFTDSDGRTLLNYWVESGCNSANTRIWVKVPNIPANSNKTIYLYYGNPSATSMSNPKNTMFIYEDMETPPSGNLAGSAIYDSTNKWVRLTPVANHQVGYLYYQTNPGPLGFHAKFRFWAGGGSGADAIWLGVYDTDYVNTREDIVKGGYHFTFDEYQDRICFTKSTTDNGNGIACATGITNIDNRQWHTAEIYYWRESNRVCARIYYDGNLVVNACDTSPQPNALNGIGMTIFGGRTGGATNEHRIDDIVVRKYVSPEPTVSLGNEEYQRNLNPIWIRYASNTSYAIINQPILFSSLWNASQIQSNLSLSHYIFSYKIGDSQWINETYRFSSAPQNWLSDWQYRIPITITERSGNTLTDYQVLVIINTQNLISQNKMRNDCGDIRFTDSDGRTLLNYWIERGCNSANTRIWVKVPNIPANSNKIIYLYYGNLNATSMSNGDATFIFFDDFRIVTSINTNKWIVSRYSGDTNNECVISNNVLWLTKKSLNKGCNILARNLNIKYNSQYTIHVKFKIDYVCAASNDGDGLAIVIDGKNNSASYGCNKGFSTTSQGIVIEIFNDRPNGDNSNGIGIDDETANCNLEGRVTSSIPQKSSDLNDGLFEIKLTGTQINVTYYDLNPANGYLIRSLITNTWNPNGNGYFMIGAGTGSSSCSNNLDSAHGIEYVFVRKYSSIEPAVSLGNEETNLPFTAWANVTKSFSQAGNLCWRFYVNNSLGLWNSTPIDCSINIIPPEFSLEVKLVQPNENSINNLTVGESLNIRANVKMKSQYNFCIDVNAYLRYNASSNMPDSLVPTSANSIMSNVNPISFTLCTNQEIPINFTIYANKPSFKVLDVNFCTLNICNDTSDFYVNISIVATRDFKLRKGWNLISIPHKFIYFDLSNDDCNIREKIFHHYNASSNSWTYFTYDKLLPGISYWVYSEKDCTSKIAVSGTVNLSDLPKAIKGRKNFIGSLTSLTNLNQVAQYIGCNNPILRYWDTSTNSFRESTILEPWKGYILECS